MYFCLDAMYLYQIVYLGKSTKDSAERHASDLLHLKINSFPSCNQSINSRRLPMSGPHKTCKEAGCPCPWNQNRVIMRYLPHENTHTFLVCRALAYSPVHSSASLVFIARADILHIPQQLLHSPNSYIQGSKQVHSLENHQSRTFTHTLCMDINTRKYNSVSHYLNTLHQYKPIYSLCIDSVFLSLQHHLCIATTHHNNDN